MNYPRQPWDYRSYLDHVTARCFICALVAGEPGYEHDVIYETDDTIAFLNRYPQAVGHSLVSPKEHREHVIGDFSEDEYLALQRDVRIVARAIQACTDCERLYILSLGSQAANAHLHWHVVPCPPGLPYQEQQVELLRHETGWLDMPDDDRRALAARLRDAIAQPDLST